jgi:hypothetical protein
LTARVLAFSRTPEGRGRDRIAELDLKGLPILGNRLGAEEQNELDHLRTLYPDLPLDPDNIFDQMLIRMKEMAKKRALEAEAQKHAQDDEPE